MDKLFYYFFLASFFKLNIIKEFIFFIIKCKQLFVYYLNSNIHFILLIFEELKH